MKRLILGSSIALAALSCTAQSAQATESDMALLGTVSRAEYLALVYTVSACGLEPSPRVALSVLRSPALSGIADALASPRAKAADLSAALDTAACAALGGASPSSSSSSSPSSTLASAKP